PITVMSLSLYLLPLLLCPLTLSAPTPPPPSLYSDIDAHAVIEPFLRPFSHMYDMMQENHKAMSYAEKIEQRRAESPLARSSGLFDLVEAEMKDVGLIPTTTTTTTPRPTTTPSIIQKSIDLLFAPKQNENGESEPGLFASMLKVMGEATAKTLSDQSDQEFRVKRRVKRQLGIGSRPSSPFDMFDNMLGFNDPVSITNPFTPNPLVSLFTTSKPMISLPSRAPPTPPSLELPSLKIPSISDAAFRMQDPFYNPLMPNRKNKLWEILDDIENNNKKMMRNLNLH
ncbi:hypothetical protein PFISCL1PPCAC_10289, partial [Pristionchus fissidentatus]